MTSSEFDGHGDVDPGVNVDEDIAVPLRLLHYSWARYVCQWMDSQGQGKLWPFYRAWRDDFTNDRMGLRAFAQVMGQTAKDANDAWVAWVLKL